MKRLGSFLLTTMFLVAIVISCSAFTADASPETAAADMANRLLGEDAQAFSFEIIASENGKDVFEVEASDGRATIRGSSGVAMASGLNWYLKYHCNCHVSWCGDQLALPDPLPDAPKFRHVSPYKYRYYFNYCTFSYSMAWWDWERWEREIDWMALNGINMPLSVTGQEALWQTLYRNMGLTDKELDAFFVGPAFLPFGWMGCMDGWCGPLSQSWIDEHLALQKRIVAREREFGMTPVLQGFTGHVPESIKRVRPDVKLQQLPSWAGFPGTYFVDPRDPLFVEIGKAFVEEQTRQFGTNHLYAADTFIEMRPPSSDPEFLAAMGKGVYEAMRAADPEAVWVMQGWIFVHTADFWKPPQAKALLGAVPDDRMILLDLFCDVKPAWNRTEAFYGKPWVWSVVHSFGRRDGMFGNLRHIASAPVEARRDPARGKLIGLGLIMEGIEQNPVYYDLLTEQAWREDVPDVDAWLKDYARRRYGKELPEAEEAWSLLEQSAYRREGPYGPVLCARPRVSDWPAGLSPKAFESLYGAWEQLLACADEVGEQETYQHDLIDVTRELLALYSHVAHKNMVQAYKTRNAAAFEAEAEKFLTLIRDLDTLLATREEFLLGKWLADATRWAKNEDERRHYEYNARIQITSWDKPGGRLNEYAQKQWAGLLRGYYLERWKIFIDHLKAALQEERIFRAEPFTEDVLRFENEWLRGQEAYASKPLGDAVAAAQRIHDTYGPLMAGLWEPDAISLTTGKPVSCSHALQQYPAELANDGCSRDTDQYWATDVNIGPEPAWWQVDLEEPTTVGRVVVVGYYADDRHYGFLVETSLDGETWDLVADRRDNTAPSTQSGHACIFPPRPVRYIRVTQTGNSANTGRHLVEVMAYSK